jgi:hypothetical protein
MPEPVIDPTTGEPVVTPAPEGIVIKQEDWDAVKSKLDAFDKGGGGGQFQPQAPVAPVIPAGPTLAEQVSEFDTKINALGVEIDTAIKDEKPISGLLSKRDSLTSSRTRLVIKSEDIDPAMSAGVQTIDQLSAEMTRGNMPYYDTVKEDYEASLTNLPAESRMQPATRKLAYEMAVGKNIDKITDLKKEEILRSAADDPTLIPGNTNSRTVDTGNPDTPKPVDVLGKDTMAALKMAGRTPDEHYKSIGYKGWDDFYEKTGKGYFEGGDE